MIGRNIRPGFTPGGFTALVGCAKTSSYVRKPKSSSSREIREAANRVLEQRGLLNEPNMRDAHNGFGRFR